MISAYANVLCSATLIEVPLAVRTTSIGLRNQAHASRTQKSLCQNQNSEDNYVMYIIQLDGDIIIYIV